MRRSSLEKTPLDPKEAGQASILLVLMLSSFLLASVGFGVDLSNVWFHRRAAQAAADAACLAGGEDLLAYALKATPPSPGFTAGGSGDCASNSAATMCKYAAFNGYSGTGLSSTAASNSVAWTSPSANTLKVTITENIRTFFMALLGQKYQQIGASATCGLGNVLTAPPIVVLDPTDSGTLYTQGTPLVQIIGGPQRSIEVNSISTTAATITGNSTGVDTSKAGPNGTGGDVAIQGNEPTMPRTYNLGTTGSWITPSLPFPDPFANVAAPTVPAAPIQSPTTVPYGQDGCPDQSQTPVHQCVEYWPGYYPTGIPVKGQTAIFRPGVYYIKGDFTMDSNSLVRNAYPGSTTGPVSTPNGIMFYLLDGQFNVAANAGQNAADPVKVSMLSCDGTIPANIPTADLTGSVLNAQCTNDGTYATQGGTGTVTSAGHRGLLFFEAHTNTSKYGYYSQGGGAFMLSGTEYFHNNSNTGIVNLQGNPSGMTYMLGYIVADQLWAQGNAELAMVLTTQKTVTSYKVALMQ